MRHTESIHAPKNMQPENYTYKGMFLASDIFSEAGEEFYADIASVQSEIFGNDRNWHFDWTTKDLNYIPNHRNGNCDHCGAHFKFGAVFTHTNGEDVVVGHQCATNAFHNTNESRDNARMMEGIKKIRSRVENAIKRAKFLADHPGLEDAFKINNHIVQDIHGRFQQYCEISPKQVELVFKIATQEAEKKQRIADREIALTDAPKITEGRQKISGTILTFKHIDTQFGTQTKILVEDSNGNRYFGTCPTDMIGADKGSLIDMTATVEVKEDHFGFFSRPKLIIEKFKMSGELVGKLLDALRPEGMTYRSETRLERELINAENNQKGEEFTLLLMPNEIATLKNKNLQ